MGINNVNESFLNEYYKQLLQVHNACMREELDKKYKESKSKKGKQSEPQPSFESIFEEEMSKLTEEKGPTLGKKR